MIDCHSHILWGVDDGAQTFEDSLSMVEIAVKSGTKILYVTPHHMPSGKYHPNLELVLEQIQLLKKKIKTYMWDIDIRSGSELYLQQDTLDVISKKSYLCYQDTDYVLIEFDPRSIHHSYIIDCMDELETQSKLIVIAHPERYFNRIKDALQQVTEWKKKGYYLQVNRTSLLGLHGKEIQRIAVSLLNKGLVHLIASDAHDAIKGRVTRLDDIYEWIRKRMGVLKANQLFIINPLALSRNEPMKELKVNAFMSQIRMFLFK